MFFTLFSYSFANNAQAGTVVSALSNTWQALSENVSETWHNPASYDLYVPAITWHHRLTCDSEKTDNYNERPWGAGGGISHYDEKENWNGLYLMAFKDSFNKWEPIGG